MTDKQKFDVKTEPFSITMSFHSSMGNIDRADEETRKFLKTIGLEMETFSVCLVMREALTNAVKHGNQSDSSKRVRYSISLRDKSLEMEIEDEGDGFNWEAIRDKQLEVFLSQSLLAKIDDEDEASVWRAVKEKQQVSGLDHGRGLTIMELYFTDYFFNDKGNKLTLVKDL